MHVILKEIVISLTVSPQEVSKKVQVIYLVHGAAATYQVIDSHDIIDCPTIDYAIWQDRVEVYLSIREEFPNFEHEASYRSFQVTYTPGVHIPYVVTATSDKQFCDFY